MTRKEMKIGCDAVAEMALCVVSPAHVLRELVYAHAVNAIAAPRIRPILPPPLESRPSSIPERGGDFKEGEWQTEK